MKTIAEVLIDLATLLLVLSGTFLKAVGFVAIAMVVLWLIGRGFPFVSQALGLPYTTVYDAISVLVESIVTLIRGS